jgi:DNA-3-methyladenine glycosylase II
LLKISSRQGKVKNWKRCDAKKKELIQTQTKIKRDRRKTMYFTYGEKELDFLRQKDKRLAEVIDRIGPVHRTVDTDLFSAVVHHIIGQQISTKAQATIWQRMCDALGTVHAKTVLGTGVEGLQALGISCKKAEYITEFAQKVLNGSFDIEAVWSMPDDEAIKALSSLNGIGVWTAEMILLFCMQRPNILSYGDLAIHRGMRMVYHHRKIDRKLFEKYRRRLSPYCSVASLYFWAVAGGALPDMKDYAPKTKKQTERQKK